MLSGLGLMWFGINVIVGLESALSGLPELNLLSDTSTRLAFGIKLHIGPDPIQIAHDPSMAQANHAHALP